MKEYLHPGHVIRLVCLGIATGVSPTVSAYQFLQCDGQAATWRSNPTVEYQPSSFPAGAWRDALEQAVGRWTNDPSTFNYHLVLGDNSVALDNGVNEIWFTSGNETCFGGRCSSALAYRWCSGQGNIIETDIIFDSNAPVPFTPLTNKGLLTRYGGQNRSFQATAIHELGHTLGLAHVNTEYNIMGSDFNHLSTNGAVARAYVGEDASDGAVFLYGLRSPPVQDVGVVHWKYKGVLDGQPEYSAHERTELYDASGVALDFFIDLIGEPRYIVDPGLVQTEFTYENNGASVQNDIKVGYYISTDATITTLDRRIREVTFEQLARANVDTRRISVIIPDDLVSGQNYWLGAIVDDDDSVDEVIEWNNATYIGIRVN